MAQAQPHAYLCIQIENIVIFERSKTDKQAQRYLKKKERAYQKLYVLWEPLGKWAKSNINFDQ